MGRLAIDGCWLVSVLRRTGSTNRDGPYPLTEPANRPGGLITGKREFGKNSKKALTVPTSTRTFRLPFVAGWSSLVARQAHNLKVAGSNPAPAPNLDHTKPLITRGFVVSTGFDDVRSILGNLGHFWAILSLILPFFWRLRGVKRIFPSNRPS